MALIDCPECKKQVSDQALLCPHCGYPFKPALLTRRSWGYEWKSQTEIFGWPLIHVAIGRDPKTRKLLKAKGIVAIGQFGLGVFTIAQFGVGYVFGFGQFILSPIAIAHFAFALVFGLGQFATGYIAIGQFAFGFYVLAQIGYGTHVWSTLTHDPQAMDFFRRMKEWLF